MLEDIERVLLSEEDIDKITSRIAAKIDEDYSDKSKKLLFVGILKGGVVFMSDLMKKIKRDVEIDFMKVSSYRSSTESCGEVNILLDLNRDDISRSIRLFSSDRPCLLFL